MDGIRQRAAVEHPAVSVPRQIIRLLIIRGGLLESPADSLCKQAIFGNLRQCDAHRLERIADGKGRGDRRRHKHRTVHAVAAVIDRGVAIGQCGGFFRIAGEDIAVAVGARPGSDPLQVRVPGHARLGQGYARQQVFEHAPLAPPAALLSAVNPIAAKRKIPFPDFGHLFLRKAGPVFLHGQQTEKRINGIVIRRHGVHTGPGQLFAAGIGSNSSAAPSVQPAILP